VQQASTASAVIRAEPDGYDIGKDRLMGRQAAGYGFLRAAVAARGEQPVSGLTASPRSAESFKALVQSIDASAAFRWIRPDQLAEVAAVGTLYVPAPSLGTEARARQRCGVASFSLCGVTHTTASLRAMDDMLSLLRDPVMPWDALVCTSNAVVATVRRVLDAEADYLRWRFGAAARLERPQLPVIPLGVHCDDFAFGDAQRRQARHRLGLSDAEVVGLFLGRLVFHAKAHPYPMLQAFEAATARTGKRLVLIFCGWFPNTAIEQAFRTGARAFAPAVRTIFLDGRRPQDRTSAWHAADLFVSLSDNIQETFGLTPIEAMASGLPVVASDWDGYRETVRHGIDGMLIPTHAPAAGSGDALALAHETGMLSYDQYCWAAASSTAVDVAQASDAVAALAADPALRRRMGEAGRQRARASYDWSAVFRQYQALWLELQQRRRAASSDHQLAQRIALAPRASASALDPFDSFAHYPSAAIGLASQLGLTPGASASTLARALDHPFFGTLPLSRAAVEAMFASLQTADRTLGELADSLGLHPAVATRGAGLLLKLGLVRLGAAA
jgi:glycosyltransferase involved in cell wall biosynthesis